MRSESYVSTLLIGLGTLVTLVESQSIAPTGLPPSSPIFAYESTKQLASAHPSPANLRPKVGGFRGIFSHGSGADPEAARVARALEKDARLDGMIQLADPRLTTDEQKAAFRFKHPGWKSYEMAKRARVLARHEEQGGWMNRVRAAAVRREIKHDFLKPSGQFYSPYWAQSPEVKTLVRTKSRTLGATPPPGPKGPVPRPRM